MDIVAIVALLLSFVPSNSLYNISPPSTLCVSINRTIDGLCRSRKKKKRKDNDERWFIIFFLSFFLAQWRVSFLHVALMFVTFAMGRGYKTNNYRRPLRSTHYNILYRKREWRSAKENPLPQKIINKREIDKQMVVTIYMTVFLYHHHHSLIRSRWDLPVELYGTVYSQWGEKAAQCTLDWIAKSAEWGGGPLRYRCSLLQPTFRKRPTQPSSTGYW
jgi:hypothetical protein